MKDNANTHFNVLFVDFMVEDQHRAYCNELINSINKFCSSVAIVKKDYLNYKQDPKHIIYYIDTKEVVGNYPIKARINTNYNFNSSKKIIDKYSFDKVIVLGYDPVMFSTEYNYLSTKGKVYLVEHHQLDEVIGKYIKLKIWKKYGLRANHILLDDSIVQETHDKLGVDINKIAVFPHPLLKSSNDLSHKNNNETIILCISNSNDITQLQDLANLEKKIHFFEHNNCEIIIRSEFNIDTDGTNCFKQINGYLSKEDYDDLYRKSNIVLMAFPTTYNMRCSGSLIDAMALGKKVVSSNIAESRQYANLFNNICRIYDNVDEIPNIVMDLKSTNCTEDFNDFRNYQIGIKEKGIKDILS